MFNSAEASKVNDLFFEENGEQKDLVEQANKLGK